MPDQVRHDRILNSASPVTVVVGVGAFLFYKEPFQPGLGYIFGNAYGINTGTGLIDGDGVDISAKDLHIEILFELVHTLPYEDGDGIGFFTV